MQTSREGLIDIVASEGICLEPYLDSVNVWTIGIGRTNHDGKDPRDFGTITVADAITLFKQDIKKYEAPVNDLNLPLKQHQFDALVSACYNFGEGNLRKLARNRTVDQIGDALILYNKPPEIIPRRRREQVLYKTGRYHCLDGKVPVFPVGPNARPQYSKARRVDIRPYFEPAIEEIVPEIDTVTNGIVGLIRFVIGLFRKS